MTVDRPTDVGARRRPRPLPATGVVTAFVFAALALTPSLVPRTPAAQIVVSAVSAVIGFTAGAALERVVVALGADPAAFAALRRRFAPQRRLISAGAVVLWIAMIAVGAVAEDARRAEWNMPLLGGPAQVVLVPLGTVAVLAAWIVAGRALREAWRLLTRFGGRWLPRLVSRLAAAVVVALVVLLTINGVLVGGVESALQHRAVVRNAAVAEGASAPASPLLSGGPGSPESWESLGRMGRAFVGSASTAEEIAAATGAPDAQDPVRVYVGHDRGRAVEETARRVVDELDRTGAWDREVLLVVFTAGQGWLNPNTPAAVEHFAGGDSAVAAMQYSFLPSGGAFVFEQDAAEEAAQALWDAVHGRWQTLPEGERPRLLVAGESLGASGGLSAFSGPADLAASTDGAVWSGTPRFSPVWQQVMATRTAGSTVVAPAFPAGSAFAAPRTPAEVAALPRWEPTDREEPVLLLQHPTDPVVWWDGRLAWREPEWLDGARADATGVPEDMLWIPGVTFWQVVLDMPWSTLTPDGVGHAYDDELVTAWGKVLGADDEEIAAVRAALRG
jgi:uncharacterized membrane protein